MFSFFEEIIDFLNALIDKYNYEDLEELGFVNQLVQLIQTILNWIKDIGFAPLGFAWIFPVTFIFLYREYRARHKQYRYSFWWGGV